MQSQCDSCGAVLLKEDLFCGECGAPRPLPVEVTTPAVAETPVAVEEPVTPVKPASPWPPKPPPVPLPPKRRSESSEAGWRVAVIALAVMGVIACLGGLISFLIFGSIGGDTTTPTENWLFATILCLLPIGGPGAILLIASLVIRNKRLKNR